MTIPPALTTAEDPLGIVGTTVDKYEIEGLVGEGGFALVYRARHTVWDDAAAIKFMTVMQTVPEEHRKRLTDDFVQEGRLMSKLSTRSSAIVQARDVGTIVIDDVDIPYMALEWLAGETLEEVMIRETQEGLPDRTLAEGLMLIRKAADGIIVAHEAGVAHRDLKPSNIMVMGDARSSDCVVKVLDFGIAKVMQQQLELAQQLHLTGNTSSTFTPIYGAPEQFSRTNGATGPWTDVYAMALMLVELVSGMSALPGDSLFEVARASCDPKRRPTMRTLGVFVTDEVEAVFEKALQIKPKKRFSDMSSFMTALDSALQAPPASRSTFRMGSAADGSSPVSLAVASAAHSSAPPSGGSDLARLDQTIAIPSSAPATSSFPAKTIALPDSDAFTIPKDAPLPAFATAADTGPSMSFPQPTIPLNRSPLPLLVVLGIIAAIGGGLWVFVFSPNAHRLIAKPSVSERLLRVVETADAATPTNTAAEPSSGEQTVAPSAARPHPARRPGPPVPRGITPKPDAYNRDKFGR